MAKVRPSRSGPLTLRFLTGPAFFKTRSLTQKSTCKGPARNGQSAAITFRPTYTPISNRASSRSQLN